MTRRRSYTTVRDTIFFGATALIEVQRPQALQREKHSRPVDGAEHSL
jgi:hypothetical protein